MLEVGDTRATSIVKGEVDSLVFHLWREYCWCELIVTIDDAVFGVALCDAHEAMWVTAALNGNLTDMQTSSMTGENMSGDTCNALLRGGCGSELN
jgi:hypothetical protein